MVIQHFFMSQIWAFCINQIKFLSWKRQCLRVSHDDGERNALKDVGRVVEFSGDPSNVYAIVR